MDAVLPLSAGECLDGERQWEVKADRNRFGTDV